MAKTGGIPDRGDLIDMRRRRATLRVLAAVLFALAGCAHEESWVYAPPFPDRTHIPPELPPPIRYCCDPVGHQAGTYPFIFGGTCVCTPSAELLAAYQHDGFLLGWTVDTLIGAYERRGITTVTQHRECNNLCSKGPHLVKGGRCMAPPTPGTLNYEEVLSGQFVLTPAEARKVAELGGPIKTEPPEPLP